MPSSLPHDASPPSGLKPDRGDDVEGGLPGRIPQPPDEVTDRHTPPSPEATADSAPRPDRIPRAFGLWIDGVGGYLVLTDPIATLGSGHGASGPERVLVEGALRPEHLRLRRDADGTVRVEPLGNRVDGLARVRLDGTPVTEPTSLRDGQIIACDVAVANGSTLPMVFHQPQGLSFSSRISFPRFERVLPHYDGLILMASTLIVGPNRGALIRLPQIVAGEPPPDLKFVARGGRLSLHFPGAAGTVWLDGRQAVSGEPLPIPCHLAGETFSLAIAANHRP